MRRVRGKEGMLEGVAILPPPLQPGEDVPDVYREIILQELRQVRAEHRQCAVVLPRDDRGDAFDRAALPAARARAERACAFGIGLRRIHRRLRAVEEGPYGIGESKALV